MNGRTNVTGGGSNGSLGGVIPLEAPSNFTVTPDNGKCLLTWTDPKDKYADEVGEITDEGDQLVSQFAYTRIVRKTGSAPSSPNDGDLVTDSSTRNQYQSSAYVDDGLTNNTLYYYAAFTCNTDGVYSGAAVGSGTPKSYDPILANNTWEQINDVANEGIAASVWNIGDEIDITLTTGENFICVIAGFDHHQLADGSGTAAITFSTKNTTTTSYSNLTQTAASANDYYKNTPMYQFIKNTLPNQIPVSLKNYMQTCITYYGNATSGFGGGQYAISTEYTADVFLLTPNEIQSGLSSNPNSWLSTIDSFSQLPYYTTTSNRIKYRNKDSSIGNPVMWALPLQYGNSTQWVWRHVYVDVNGDVTTTSISSGINVSTYCSFAFCVGKTPS